MEREKQDGHTWSEVLLSGGDYQKTGRYQDMERYQFGIVKGSSTVHLRIPVLD